MANNTGEYGGKVKRAFKGDGMNWIAGAILTPEDVARWPLANKIALHKNGNVDWFGAPNESEQEAREQGKPAPVRGKVASKDVKAPTAKEQATGDKPKATGSRRTRATAKA